MESLNYHQYEDYTLNLNKKQLTRFANMDDTVNSTHQGMGLKEITIADAPDLVDTDFACYYNQATGVT
jgi:hypothetical protein